MIHRRCKWWTRDYGGHCVAQTLYEENTSWEKFRFRSPCSVWLARSFFASIETTDSWNKRKRKFYQQMLNRLRTGITSRFRIPGLPVCLVSFYFKIEFFGGDSTPPPLLYKKRKVCWWGWNGTGDKIHYPTESGMINLLYISFHNARVTRELKNRRQSSMLAHINWCAVEGPTARKLIVAADNLSVGFGHWICVGRIKPAQSVTCGFIDWAKRVSSIKLTSRFANLNKILLALKTSMFCKFPAGFPLPFAVFRIHCLPFIQPC